MKKIFVCLLAVAALASCQKNEIISTVGGPAIAFENAFVDKATKADPSTTTASIAEFSVWGYMDQADGVVFNEELVSKNGAEWGYTNTQYWTPKHTYVFNAISPVKHDDVVVNTNDAAVESIDFTNTDGTVDLLHETQTVETGATVEAMEPVGLTFSHLLSKVKFSFTNGFDNANSTIVVTGIEMTAPKKGNVAVADYAWTNLAETTTLAFGNANAGQNIATGATVESDDERLTIPAGTKQEYVVTFHVELWNGAVLAVENKLTTNVTGVALEVGKAYNFKAELNAANILGPEAELLPIEFTVLEVEEWVPAADQKGVLGGAVKNQTMMTDAVATAVVAVNGTLDGAGHTLEAKEGVNYVVSNTARLIEATAPSTIKNIKIDGKGNVYNGFGIRGIYTVGNGDVTIENVEILDCTYAINANNTGKVTVLNSTLQGWNSYGAGSENYFENVKFIDGKFHNFRPYNNTVCKNCDFGAGVVIDLSCLVEGATVEFIDCTVAGQPMTMAQEDVVVTEAPVKDGLVLNTEFVQGITIDGNNLRTQDNKALRGLYITKGGVYNVNDVVVKNVVYALNVNTTEEVVLNIVNSTLEGWSSFGNSTTAAFTNVKFECGQYANFKPYTSTTLTNCSFEKDFMIDFTSLDGVITFKNCTYNGTVLTAENFATVAKVDGDCAGKIAF